ARHSHKRWFRSAKRLGEAAFGGSNFRTIVYDEDPNEPRTEITLHYDSQAKMLRVLPPGGHEVAFTWKVSMPYLRDVVDRRPQWYMENPTMLDWNWLAHRIGDEAQQRDGETLTLGFLHGSAFAFVLCILLSRRREHGR
ncbi:hypothetical protein QUG69_23800, partial [Enterobacter hormaechei]|uniref:hypothetical protein n=1 Tax=Enterobacter hormaechei TaxID=158836 RepID=UPI0025A09899